MKNKKKLISAQPAAAAGFAPPSQCNCPSGFEGQFASPFRNQSASKNRKHFASPLRIHVAITVKTRWQHAPRGKHGAGGGQTTPSPDHHHPKQRTGGD